MLLAFAGVSVFVGAFIIFNAFSITVAQRRREFAMLRALGASRRQVLTAVVGEALAIGIGASLAGIAAGLGVAKGINALFKALGSDIPTSGIVLEPRTIAIAVTVGVVVTLLSALAPAVRATHVPPVAALQQGAALPRGRFARLSTPAAALCRRARRRGPRLRLHRQRRRPAAAWPSWDSGRCCSSWASPWRPSTSCGR